jgi:sporulation-control protein
VFKKFLSKIGVGNTKVNLLLPKEEFVQGETFQAKIVIEPGSTEQQIDHIAIVLESSHAKDENKKDNFWLQKKINEKFVIKPGSPVKEIPLEITIPRNTPISIKGAKHYFKTSLDVDDALDPTDRDYIIILPCAETAAVLAAIEGLGFVHKSEDGISSGGKVVKGRQEFNFKPSDMLHGKIRELEVDFRILTDSVDLYMEFEKSATGLKPEKEKHAKLRISNDDIKAGSDRIKELLASFIQEKCACM